MAARINRYITFGRNDDEINSSKEKNFVKNLQIPKSTYLEVKQRIIRELIKEKEKENEKEDNTKSIFFS